MPGPEGHSNKEVSKIFLILLTVLSYTLYVCIHHTSQNISKLLNEKVYYLKGEKNTLICSRRKSFTEMLIFASSQLTNQVLLSSELLCPSPMELHIRNNTMNNHHIKWRYFKHTN